MLDNDNKQRHDDKGVSYADSDGHQWPTRRDRRRQAQAKKKGKSPFLFVRIILALFIIFIVSLFGYLIWPML